MAATPPPAQGVRLLWNQVPESIQAAFEAWAGSRVVEAVSQPGGFSPGVAARLRLADGRRLFVKAVSGQQNIESPYFHRREARVMQALPALVPAPRLLWVLDEDEGKPRRPGEPGGWVLLAFDDIAGRQPAQPWQRDELERVMVAMNGLMDELTPSPLQPPVVGSAREAFTHHPWGGGLVGWQRLRDALAEGGTDQVDRLAPWARANLDRLAGLEALAPDAADGNTLLHFDTRADNILLTPERVWFVDWPHASVGAPWVEVVGFAPSVTMQGGPDPEELLAMHPAARRADPQAINAVIAALSGFFVQRSLEPDPPGLPTLRAFQAAQGAVALDWLERRLASPRNRSGVA